MKNNERYLAFCSLYSNSYVGVGGMVETMEKAKGKCAIEYEKKRKVVWKEGLKSNRGEQDLVELLQMWKELTIQDSYIV